MAEKSESEIKALMQASGIGNKHNWLYSFLPYQYNMNITPIFYLLGYCKQCNQTVSVVVPVGPDNKPHLARVNIPKDDCDWGEAK